MYVIELYMEIGTIVLSSSSNQFNGHGTYRVYNFYICENKFHFQSLNLLIMYFYWIFAGTYFEGLTIEVFMNEIGSEARSI